MKHKPIPFDQWKIKPKTRYAPVNCGEIDTNRLEVDCNVAWVHQRCWNEKDRAASLAKGFGVALVTIAAAEDTVITALEKEVVESAVAVTLTARLPNQRVNEIAEAYGTAMERQHAAVSNLIEARAKQNG